MKSSRVCWPDYNQAVGVAVDALIERAPNPRRCERGEVFKGPVTVLVDVKDESGAVIGQVERPMTLSDAKNAKGGFHARVQAINAWLAAAQPDVPLIPEYCACLAAPDAYLRTDKDGKRKDECMADFPSQKRWSGEWWRFWREHIEPAIAGNPEQLRQLRAQKRRLQEQKPLLEEQRRRAAIEEGRPRSGVHLLVSQPALERTRTQPYSAVFRCFRYARSPSYSRGATNALHETVYPPRGCVFAT